MTAILAAGPWLRSFSVVCGVAAVGVVWMLARELVGPTDEPGDRLRGDVAAATAGLLLALSPSAIQLSQVMRPYMLQVSLLAGAAYFLLRFREDGGTRALAGYTTLGILAALTHYSSALALGAFGLLVIFDVATHPSGPLEATRDPELRRLVLASAAPLAVLAGLYLSHARSLSTSALADEALNGWLSFYMIDAPPDAWLGYLGVKSLVSHAWLRGPTALLAVAGVVVSLRSRDRTLGVLTVGALVIALLAATLGAYPFGSTRHSSWLLVFLLPAVGGAIGAIARSAIREGARAVPAAAVLLVGLGGPVGLLLGLASAPWAPTEHVLRQADLTQMVDVMDPSGEPHTIAMSAQTFYLLLPFYASERERARFSADGDLFHFRYGERDILVTQAWDFTAGPDPSATGHLAGVLAAARDEFPSLELDSRRTLSLLVGGWRPPFVDELDALALTEPFGRMRRNVPGLYAFETDLPVLMHALGIAGATPQALGR